MSWGSITWELNHTFADYNGGKRIRSTVWKWAAEDQKAFVSKTLKIPKDLSDTAAAQGLDLNDLLVRAVTSSLKRAKR